MSNLDTATMAAAALSAFLGETNKYADQRRQQEIQALGFLGNMPQNTVTPDPTAERAGFLSRLFGYDYKPRADRMPVVAMGGTPFTITPTPKMSEVYPDIANNEMLGAAAPLMADMYATNDNKKALLGAVMDFDKQKRGHTFEGEQIDKQIGVKKSALEQDLDEIRNKAVGNLYEAYSEAGMKLPEGDYGTMPLSEITRLYAMVPPGRGKSRAGKVTSPGTDVMEKVNGSLETIAKTLGVDQDLARMLIASGRSKKQVDELLKKMGKSEHQAEALSNVVMWHRTYIDKLKMDLMYYQGEPGVEEAMRILDTLTANDKLPPNESSIYPRQYKNPNIDIQLAPEAQPEGFGSPSTPGKPRLRIREEYEAR